MDENNKVRKFWCEEKPVKVLLIEDNPDHILLIKDALVNAKNAPFDLEQVDLLSQGLTRLAEGNIDAVLLDLLLPDSQGLKTFTEINNQTPGVPIVILSALDDEVLAVKAVQAGAQDYLIKGQFDSRLLGRSLCYAIKRQRLLGKIRQSKQELKIRNIILSTQQETSLDGILVVDKDGRMSSFNQRFIDMWGLPADIVESKSDERALEWVYNKLVDPEQFIARVKYLYKHQEKKSQDVIALADGRIFERYSAPMLESTGKNYGRVWYFRDITERKRTEEELTQYRQHLEELVEERTAELTEVNKNLKQEVSEHKRTEEELRKFKFINDNSNDAHFLLGRDAKFKYVNKTACKMTGYSESELLGLEVPDVDNVYDMDKYQELFDRIQKETVPPIETVNRRKDGTVFPSEITVTGYQIDGTSYMFAALRDISKRKQAEEALKSRQQEIEELNANLEKRVHEEVEKSRQKDRIMIHQSRLAAMGEMIGLIAHQWKQPLNALNILLYNIEDFCNENHLRSGTLDSFFEKGMNLIEKMSSTIDDFRNFFKPTKKKEKFCINQIIKESFSMVDTDFEFNDISVSINEKGQLDAMGFPNEYSQVILNILNNAKDAIVAQGVKGEVVIDVLQQNNSAIVKIKDNGGGIPEDVLKFIFDPYFTTRQETKGTGIGLYMSKVIIEDHMDGHVNVQNVVGGVEFSITTPLVSLPTDSQ